MPLPRAQTPGASVPTDSAGLPFGAIPRTVGICATVQPQLLARLPISSGGDPAESGRAFAGAVRPAFLLPDPSRIDAARFCDPGYLAEWLRAANSELLGS